MIVTNNLDNDPVNNEDTNNSKNITKESSSNSIFACSDKHSDIVLVEQASAADTEIVSNRNDYMKSDNNGKTYSCKNLSKEPSNVPIKVIETEIDMDASSVSSEKLPIDTDYVTTGKNLLLEKRNPEITDGTRVEMEISNINDNTKDVTTESDNENNLKAQENLIQGTSEVYNAILKISENDIGGNINNYNNNTDSVHLQIPSTSYAEVTNVITKDKQIVVVQKENATDRNKENNLKTEETDNKKRVLDDNGMTDMKESSLLVEQATTSRVPEANVSKRRKVELFTTDEGPQWYKVKGNLVTPPVIPKNLTNVFEYLPIFGKPKSKNDLENFQNEKLREFVGCDLADDEFEELAKYCSPDHLKTGQELLLKTSLPSQGALLELDTPVSSSTSLCTLKKNKLRIEKDGSNAYQIRLKYRGVRLIPLGQQEGSVESSTDTELEPGKDILYRVRVYRPYCYLRKERNVRGRHSVFSCDVVVAGRQRLAALRDRIVCANDLDMRVDVSATHDAPPGPSAKDVFPSGFLFINNTFYVDSREGCVDHSAIIRQWAAKRGLGVFPKKDMCSVTFDDLVLKLGYPDVYVHQGNCEHVFIFSEIRLVSGADELSLARYPCHGAVSQNQTVYCTTCAEFGAKWVVVGCGRVPFDPAFFCDPCLRLYLYKDGQKIGDFKAYPYRGNEINMLKPQG